MLCTLSFCLISHLFCGYDMLGQDNHKRTVVDNKKQALLARVIIKNDS